MAPVLDGARIVACTINPVSEFSPSARPLPWSAPMVGSSMTRIVLSGSNCLHSHAHDATSQTNIRGRRMIWTWRLRTRDAPASPAPPAVSWMRSIPRRSFSSISATDCSGKRAGVSELRGELRRIARLVPSTSTRRGGRRATST